MALYNFHRVLIASAILFFFGFALWAFKQGSTFNNTMGAASLFVSLSMVGYLIYFNYRIRGLGHNHLSPR